MNRLDCNRELTIRQSQYRDNSSAAEWRGPIPGFAFCRQTVIGLCLAVVTALLGTNAIAQETAPVIRQVFVPAGQLDSWPKGQREEISFEEYRELQAALAQSDRARRSAHMEWQSLGGTFDVASGSIVEGRWAAEVRGKAAAAAFLLLDPLDLAISSLRWSDGDAVWGTSPAGQRLLRVNSAQRRLEGEFTLSGRRLRRSIQFQCKLAPATVSEITLRVPSGFQLKCDAGRLRSAIADGDGWRLWRIDLGGRSDCEILIVPAKPAVAAESVVLYEQESSYVLRESEIELQCEITAEVFHTPVSTMALTLPDELSIHSIDLAGDARLNWRDLSRVPGQPRQIEVRFPEPQFGRIRSLRILAGSVAKWETQPALPRLLLSGGWFVGGQWNVAVDSPLIWRALRPVGLRMTEIDANESETRRLSFVQFLPDATLSIDLSKPAAQLSVRGVQRLLSRDSDWRLTSEWRWQSIAGTAFSTRYRIPPGWEIEDVQAISESEPANLRHWDVIDDSSGDRVLTCEFSRALAGRARQRVRIDARLLRVLDSDREELDLPTPLDSRHIEQLLVVTTPDGWRWAQKNDGESTVSNRVALNESWQDFEPARIGQDEVSTATMLSPQVHAKGVLRTVLSFLREPLTGNTPTTNANLDDRIGATAEAISNSPAPANGTGMQTSTLNSIDAGRLVWRSAELRSLIFPGGEGDDLHWLTLEPALAVRVDRLEFEFPESVEIVSIHMNGVRTEAEHVGGQIRLPGVPGGGLDSLDIRYRVPSERGFLRFRQTVPLPQFDTPVLSFRWLLALPSDSRLGEEPAGMKLLQPLDPTPWLRRIFGPLGRDSLREWFNPFQQRAWLELWTSKESAFAPSHKTGIASFAPPGWSVREAVAATLPAEIQWVTWNDSQVRTLAWIGMWLSIAVGCVLRWRRVKPRVRIAALWLGFCLVGAILSLPVYAEILGGCVIGALIAVLIPRRLIMSYAKAQAAEARGAFEPTVALPNAIGAVFIAIFVVWSSSIADEPARRASQDLGAEFKNGNAGSLRKTFDVLIPVDAPAKAIGEVVQPSEKLPWVFVPVELMTWWREQKAQRAEPETLLSAAEYQVTREQQQFVVSAEFLVHRMARQRATQLRFPFGGLPLAGENSCLVDGQPAPVSLSASRDALVIDLPAVDPNPAATGVDDVVSQRVSFRFWPLTSEEDSTTRLKMRSPAVLRSRMTVRGAGVGGVEVPQRRGFAASDESKTVWSSQLGMCSEWTLLWPINGVVRMKSATDVRTDVTCLCELLPTALRQRYRVRYRVASGEVDDVVWRLPRGAVLRDGEVIANDLLQWFVADAPDGEQLLVIEFSRPQSEEFTVDVAGLQPMLGTSENPRWEPWQIDGVESGELKLRSFHLGVTTMPGFRLTPPSPDPDRAAVLSESDYLKGWGTEVLPRPPFWTVQLNSPSPLAFTVTPSTAQRQVRQELVLTFGRSTFDWELHAEVSTQSAPAFQHDLTLPAGFDVLDASITEDEAERLLHWTTNGNRLSSFLRDETAGIQNLYLHGQDVLPADGRLSIPTRWFEGASATEFSVRITHDPRWQVEVLEDGQSLLSPVETGGSASNRPELFLGKFRPAVGAAQIDVRLQPHIPASAAEAWTSVAHPTGDSWVLRHAERLLDEGLVTARVHWPNSWAKSGSVRVSSSLKELARRAVADGIEITVQSVPGDDSPRDVFFESNLTTSNIGPRRIPAPSALDIRKRHHTWLVTEALHAWLPMSADVRAADDIAKAPDVVRRLLSGIETNWNWVTATTGDLQLLPPREPAVKPAANIPWWETTVWISDGVIAQGRTSFFLQPRGLQEFTLGCPEGTHWLAAFVDETPLQPPPDDGPWTLAELPQQSWLWVNVFWTFPASQSDRVVLRRDSQLPMPVDPRWQPEQHDLLLIASGHSDLSFTHGARRIPDWDRRLSRAGHFTSMLQSAGDGSAGNRNRIVNRIREDIAAAKNAITASGTEIGAATVARQRLQSVESHWSALNADQGRDVPRTSQSAEADRWVSDLWWQIPNSWAAVGEPSDGARLSVILVDRRWLMWVIAFCSAIPVILVVRIWLRWQTGEWLAAHPYFAWGALGVIWWTCLDPSVIGFALLVLAVLVALRDRRRSPVPILVAT